MLQMQQKNKAKREEMMNDLCPCEKYMVAMMGVPNAASKFKCMLFQIQFKSRIEEINESIETLLTACNDVKSSERLQKLMAIILTIGNQINTGGDGNMAAGFTLDALLKLNEAKAFDKKTSVLQYVIKVINKNDPTILKFKEEILSIEKAKDITLDAMLGDLKQLQSELEEVKKAAEVEGEKLRGDDGKLTNPNIKMTLAELKEQKTSNRIINGVKYFNQMEHEKEFTPMEIFSQSAEFQVLEATEKTDEVKDGFSSVLKYFGEDEKMSTTDFFGTLSSFLQCFESEKDFFERQEEQRRRDERRAAAKKEKEAKRAANSPKKSVASPKRKDMQMGSMTAAAALAAQKKKKKAQDCDSNEATVKMPEAPPMGLGGIAAAAALAAQKKTKKLNSIEVVRDFEIEKTESSKTASVHEPTIIVKPIAKRPNLERQAKNDGNNKFHNLQKESIQRSDSAPKEKKKGRQTFNSTVLRPNTQVEEKPTNLETSSAGTDSTPAFNPLAGGGIAAAAALAAQKRSSKAQARAQSQSQSQVKESNEDNSTEAPSAGTDSTPAFNPLAGGGIAAAAALAAQKRSNKAYKGTSSVGSSSDCRDDDSTVSIGDSMGQNPIAAAVAEAARKRLNAANPSTDMDGKFL